jgi:hypothetical protein
MQKQCLSSIHDNLLTASRCVGGVTQKDAVGYLSGGVPESGSRAAKAAGQSGIGAAWVRPIWQAVCDLEVSENKMKSAERD